MKPREYLIELFKALQRGMPAPDGKKHAMMGVKYGSDATGYEDKLALMIAVPEGFRALFIEDEDLQKSPSGLAADCFNAVHALSTNLSSTLPKGTGSRILAMLVCGPRSLTAIAEHLDLHREQALVAIKRLVTDEKVTTFPIPKLHGTMLACEERFAIMVTLYVDGPSCNQ